VVGMSDDGQSLDGTEQEDLCCWVVSYHGEKDGYERERFLGQYPVGQEDNPWSEVLIAGWSA